MKNSCYSIRTRAALAGAIRTAEVFIFGDIGESWYGDSVAAKDFVREIAALDVDEDRPRVIGHG